MRRYTAMRPRLLTLLVTGVLIAQLLAVPGHVRAQEPPLTNTFSWDAYGVTVQYPDGWIIVDRGLRVSLRPADRDVSAGIGPELVLFVLPDASADNLAALANEYAAGVQGATSAVQSGTLAGNPSREFTFMQNAPAAAGGVVLMAGKGLPVTGVAYIMPQEEAEALLPVFLAMVDSVQVTEGGRSQTSPLPGRSDSTSVTSVQLDQRYVWRALNLALYFPADWRIESEVGSDGEEIVIGLPALDSVFDRSGGLIRVAVFPWSPGLDLRDLAEDTITEFGTISGVHDVMVAGYPGVAFDLIDDSDDAPYYVRSVTVAMEDREIVLVIVAGVAEPLWPEFRPLVSAFLSSIERVAASADLPWMDALSTGTVFQSSAPATGPRGLPVVNRPAA